MTACPLETEMAEHRFVCQLRAGHDGGHQWWLAAPVNTWLEMPLWTAETLTEDDWENDGHALSFTVTDPGDGGPDRDIRTTREAT